MRKELNRLWSEFERLWRLGERYSALLNVAEIHACLEKLEPNLRREFESRCQSVQLTRDVLEAADAGIKRDERRILRVLSVGNLWNDDEFLLLITLKVQTDLLLAFLNARGKNLRSESDAKCLLAIKAAAESIENRNAYRQAVSLVRQNWRLPVPHELFVQYPKSRKNS